MNIAHQSSTGDGLSDNRRDGTRAGEKGDRIVASNLLQEGEMEGAGEIGGAEAAATRRGEPPVREREKEEGFPSVGFGDRERERREKGEGFIKGLLQDSCWVVIQRPINSELNMVHEV